MTDEEMNKIFKRTPGSTKNEIDIGDKVISFNYYVDGIEYFYYNGVRVYLDRIKMFLKGNYDKLVVGYKKSNLEECIMTKDSDYFYIGCLKEKKKDFIKKYLIITKKK